MNWKLIFMYVISACFPITTYQAFVSRIFKKYTVLTLLLLFIGIIWKRTSVYKISLPFSGSPSLVIPSFEHVNVTELGKSIEGQTNHMSYIEMQWWKRFIDDQEKCISHECANAAYSWPITCLKTISVNPQHPGQDIGGGGSALAPMRWRETERLPVTTA